MKALKKALLSLGLGMTVLMATITSAYAYPPYDTVVEWLIECQAGSEASCVKVDRYGGYYSIYRWTDPGNLPYNAK
jgi:hypothetical protein